MRSRPMPVSIDGAGSGVSTPSAFLSNSMNTLFQISTNRPLSAITSARNWLVPEASGTRS